MSIYRAVGTINRMLLKNAYNLILATTMLTAPVVAQDKDDNNIPEGFAIDGYSPVSYFEKDIAEQGSEKFSVEHDNKISRIQF